MRNILSWDGEDWLGAIGLTALIAVLVLLGVIITANHTPKQYYVGGGANGMICAVADNPWDEDHTVFCSLEADKALEFIRKANEELRKAAR